MVIKEKNDEKTLRVSCDESGIEKATQIINK